MLKRTLDDSYPAPVRQSITVLTLTRLTANAAYRFAPPFLATIARGLDVELADLGVAVAISELCGLSSPLLGRVVDRLPRRRSMLGGLLGIAAGVIIAASAPGVVMFGVGLFVLAIGKITFDVGMGAWIADHVPYERRGRVVGLTETSWALGLLVGVTSMGLITAATSWRWGYVAGAVAVIVMAGVLAARLDSTPAQPHGNDTTLDPIGRLPLAGWLAVLAMLCLTAAAQSLFVTFGAWLEDEFAVTSAGLAAVTFGIGALELVASTTSAARTDRWGKERSVIAGTMVMAPTAMLLAGVEAHAVPGLLALGVFIGAFEFSIVSAIPIGGELVPSAPGRGIGTMVAFGTLGRAVTAVPATRLYDRWGLTPTALMGAAFALLAGGAMTLRLRTQRAHRTPDAPVPEKAPVDQPR